MLNQGNAFEPLDFERLKELADNGDLHALIAFTTGGQITIYAPQDGQQVRAPAGEPHAAAAVQYTYASSSYYYCNTNTHTWWYCYIDASGERRCRDTGQGC